MKAILFDVSAKYVKPEALDREFETLKAQFIEGQIIPSLRISPVGLYQATMQCRRMRNVRVVFQ